MIFLVTTTQLQAHNERHKAYISYTGSNVVFITFLGQDEQQQQQQQQQKWHHIRNCMIAFNC